MIYDQIIEKIRNLKKEYKIWKEENILIEKEEKYRKFCFFMKK